MNPIDWLIYQHHWYFYIPVLIAFYAPTVFANFVLTTYYRNLVPATRLAGSYDEWSMQRTAEETRNYNNWKTAREFSFVWPFFWLFTLLVVGGSAVVNQFQRIVEWSEESADRVQSRKSVEAIQPIYDREWEKWQSLPYPKDRYNRVEEEYVAKLLTLEKAGATPRADERKPPPAPKAATPPPSVSRPDRGRVRTWDDEPEVEVVGRDYPFPR